VTPVPTAPPAAGLLDRQPWAHRTSRFQALDFDFAVQVTDPALGAYLDQAFAALAVEGTPSHVYSVLERPGSTRRSFAVYLDDRPVDTLTDPGTALSCLLLHINRRAVAASCADIVLHASAVARGGDVAMFPAPTESGKTTLAAGLVRAGFAYVTDEAVALDATGTVRPYPRPLAVDRGSWDVLADLRPSLTEAQERYVTDQWHLGPTQIGTVAGPGVPRLVVAPRYVAGATTELVPMSRADAVAMLVTNSFNFEMHAPAALETLASVVRSSSCYRLVVGDLDAACAAVGTLFDGLGARRP
jgi:hypothetical protein